MVIGDMPPPDCALGVEGPRGPFCIPFKTSSKPMDLSWRVRPTGARISARYDGYKATSRSMSATNHSRHKGSDLLNFSRGKEWIGRLWWQARAASAALSAVF
jgi:hypothetical protein